MARYGWDYDRGYQSRGYYGGWRSAREPRGYGRDYGYDRGYGGGWGMAGLNDAFLHGPPPEDLGYDRAIHGSRRRGVPYDRGWFRSRARANPPYPPTYGGPRYDRGWF